MKCFLAVSCALALLPRPLVVCGAMQPDPDLVLQWDSAGLRGIRESKLSVSPIARALAIVHTCMYDAWATCDESASSTQLAGALRRPASERTLANKEKAISYAAIVPLPTFCQPIPIRFTSRL